MSDSHALIRRWYWLQHLSLQVMTSLNVVYTNLRFALLTQFSVNIDFFLTISNFLTWLLIGCQHSRQLFRSHVGKWPSIGSDFDREPDFSRVSNPSTWGSSWLALYVWYLEQSSWSIYHKKWARSFCLKNIVELLNRYNAHWVTHSTTLGKHNAPLLLFTWKMFILTYLTNIYVLESFSSRGGGWGCEVSCGGHHRPRGKTTTGSALDGAVFDIAQILAYLVHNMSRSQLYLGFGHFGWLPSIFDQ